MADEIDFENGRVSNFEDFITNQKRTLWTVGRKYGWQTRLLGGLSRGVDLKQQTCAYYIVYFTEVTLSVCL